MTSGLLENARALVDQRRFVEAIEAINHLSPESRGNSGSLMARALIGLGRNCEAESVMRDIPEQQRDNEDFRNARNELMWEYQIFMPMWRKEPLAWAKEPFELAKWAARFHFFKAEWEEARAQMHEALALRDDLELRCWQAHTTSSQGWLKEGFTALENLREAHRDHPLPYQWLALTKAATGNGRGVVEEVASNLQRFPEDLMTWRSAIHALDQVSEAEQAAKLLSRAEESFPSISAFRLLRAEKLRLAGDERRVYEIAKSVLAEEPLHMGAQRLLLNVVRRRWGPVGVGIMRVVLARRACLSIQLISS
jgi:tetratricopeptide (TPR) repeat protein